ncbi:site-specific DNA-methyltransferase [Candidatus Acetothermia bacterium]|jgi:DNA modification methylase|nr:site-specific DNA-methyltransferase [Candidatus Acetothermia bacterium]MCI2432677.1 site-specific DNA-methyltransferase [Candidatus Acetothermia bacterium]MCI2436065.1 site-specific DNA-methyltransferase [Candidatus Acetothermia bacterium]
MTELIWEGKYDKDGKKTAPLRVALPFQTVETVNESAQDRQKSLELFRTGRTSEWRNRLIWGDKKYVLPSLLPEFAGRVNLIYIDPPFDTGADFSFQVEIDGENFTKEPSIIEMKAYRDTWGRGLDSYLQWFYETVVLLRELLHETGSIYVHLDWHVGHYAKAIMDEIFGQEHFLNEVIWKRTFNVGSSKAISKKFPINNDYILYYVKSASFVFNKQYTELSEGALKRYDKVDEQGRRFKWNPMKTYSEDKLKKMLATGEAMIIPTSKYPVYKHYLDEGKGKVVDNIWDDLPHIGTFAEERVNYSTQKPEALLERIIKTSSNPGDLVLDCFVGSGTTAAVAEKLGRRWIACDLGRFAVHTTRKRLLSIPNVKPFIVQNLGKYERQVWQAAEFGEEAEAKTQAYRRFILELYHAQPITGYSWLHGVKAGRMVHVGAVDSPVSPGDIAQIAAEFKKAIGTGKDAPTVNGVDVLGWDFAFELNEVAKQQAAQANIQMRFLKIPRDVMDKRAVEQGDIQFFELAALSVDVQTNGKTVTLKLMDFVIPPDEVPEEVQRAIKHWSQWIDYWAVDWNNNGDTFHNEWQDYRTRKKRDLQMQVAHTYSEPGEYTIVVKVIDILGNDTTKTIRVRVR